MNTRMSSSLYDVVTPAKVRVCIVGAGITGLSTALVAIEEGVLSGDQITIMAEKFYTETTSYIAAGFFRPEEDPAPDLETTERWYRDTFEHYKRLDALGQPHVTGVKKITGYNLSSYSPQGTTNRINNRIFTDLRTLTDEELKQFPKKYKYGIFHSTYIADPAIYLKYLEGQLRQRGVQFIQYRVDDFAELAKHYQIVVNCTALASKKLANDHRMVPIRGQVVKVRNHPEVKHFYYGDEFYILPGIDWVTLGGTKDYNDSDVRVSERDRDHILKGCTELLPSLKHNEEIADMVGLRPHRSPVRVEAERLALALAPGQQSGAWLVHNYGHGGQGVNLSWGTAREAVRLIQRCITSDFTKARL